MLNNSLYGNPTVRELIGGKLSKKSEILATNVSPIIIFRSIINYTLSLCDKQKAKLSQAEIIRIFHSIFADIILNFLSPSKF